MLPLKQLFLMLEDYVTFPYEFVFIFKEMLVSIMLSIILNQIVLTDYILIWGKDIFMNQVSLNRIFASSC